MDKAWLTAVAAVLGVSEACQRHDAPSAAREVAPLASASASASAEPSATVMVEAALPSASASATPMASTSSTSESLLRIGAGVGTGCGVRASCGASTRNASKPTAQVNATIESGVAGDDRIIAGLRARFRSCANQGLAQDPSMRGRIVVYVNIAANGSVIDTSNSRIVGISQSVADCMIASIKRAQFVASTPRHASVMIEQTQQ